MTKAQLLARGVHYASCTNGGAPKTRGLDPRILAIGYSVVRDDIAKVYAAGCRRSWVFMPGGFEPSGPFAWDTLQQRGTVAVADFVKAFKGTPGRRGAYLGSVKLDRTAGMDSMQHVRWATSALWPYLDAGFTEFGMDSSCSYGGMSREVELFWTVREFLRRQGTKYELYCESGDWAWHREQANADQPWFHECGSVQNWTNDTHSNADRVPPNTRTNSGEALALVTVDFEKPAADLLANASTPAAEGYTVCAQLSRLLAA